MGVEKDAVLHPLNNLTINWEKLLNEGLSGRLELCREKLSKTKDKQKRDFLEAAVIVIEAVANLAERYETAAEAAGNHSVAESFRRVPLYGAKTLQEAMQSIRLMSALLYYAGCAHIGLTVTAIHTLASSRETTDRRLCWAAVTGRGTLPLMN